MVKSTRFLVCMLLCFIGYIVIELEHTAGSSNGKELGLIQTHMARFMCQCYGYKWACSVRVGSRKYGDALDAIVQGACVCVVVWVF